MKWDELYISEEYESDYWSLHAFFEVFIFCFSSTFYILHTSFMSPCMRLVYISEWFHNSACRKVSGYILWRFSIWKVSLPPYYSDAILHLISSIFYYFFWNLEYYDDPKHLSVMQISILLALPVYISLCNDYNRCLLLASGTFLKQMFGSLVISV